MKPPCQQMHKENEVASISVDRHISKLETKPSSLLFQQKLSRRTDADSNSIKGLLGDG